MTTQRLREEGPLFRNCLIQRFRLQGDVLFACGFLFLILLHPGLPAFACGSVFAGEGKRGDVGVRNRNFLIARFRIEADDRIGERFARAAIEDVAFELLAVLQRDGYVAAIIEGFFECEASLFVSGQLRNPAFEVFALASWRVFKLFGVGGATLGYAHARVSSRALVSICTRGPACSPDEISSNKRSAPGSS